jgi:DNA-3-methyladenine glycosylase II
MPFTKTFTIQALGPFNFDLTAQIFSNGDPAIRTYTNGVFNQVLKINGNLVLIKVGSSGTVEKPELSVMLNSNIALTMQDKKAARKIVEFIFNLGFDLTAFYLEVKKIRLCTG